MALLDSEGFGFSTNILDFTNYNVLTVQNNQGGQTIATGGPFGDNYLTMNINFLRRLMASGASTFFYGHRMLTGSTATIVFQDVLSNELFHVTFSNPTGTISVIRGATTLGTAPAGSLPGGASAWNYVEVGAVISTTVGSVIVRVNGVTVLTLSGVNTQNSTVSALMQQVMWEGQQVAHVYFCDNTGPAPWNTFLGDVRVQTLRVTSNDAVQFTPTPASLTVSTGTVSTTTNNSATANTVYYQKLTVGTVGGILTQADMALATSFTGNAHMALYASNAANTAPSGAPLATSAAVANPVAGTVTFAFSGGPRLSAGIYWLALQTDTTSSWRQNTSNPATSECSQAQAYTSGFPTTPAPGTVGTALFFMDMPYAPTNADVIALTAPLPTTDYNADSNVGDQDTFNMTPMASSLTTVLGLNVKALAYKSDAGARSLEAVLKSGATTVTGTSVSLSVSPVQQRAMYQADPNTSAQWSQAAVNAAKAGYKVSA